MKSRSVALAALAWLYISAELNSIHSTESSNFAMVFDIKNCGQKLMSAPPNSKAMIIATIFPPYLLDIRRTTKLFLDFKFHLVSVSDLDNMFTSNLIVSLRTYHSMTQFE